MNQPLLLAILPVLAATLTLNAASWFTAGHDKAEVYQAQTLGRPTVVLYVEANFKGRATRVKAPEDFPGSAALKEIGIKNDSLLSMKVPAGVRVSVYDADNYGGDSLSFTEGEHASLGNLANRISSMKIEMIEKK